MCGIYGVQGTARAPLKGLAALRRRGPDDRGVWEDAEARIWLGQVRLSIQDTSSAGHQPMLSHDGRVVMIYNGEIYNVHELRAGLEARGERFAGHSDSEVLLAMFAREGAQCLDRVNGIFAVAFWERDRRVLTIARDPLGVKPLYWTQGGGRFAFASEMKALLRSGEAAPTLEPRAVLHHLGFLWSPGGDTLVQGVHKLLPGEAAEIHAGGLTRRWRFRGLHYDPVAPASLAPDAAAREVAATVERAVQRQMISDVPVGAFLSGGLDSSAVVAFARRHVERLPCFSIELAGEGTAAEGFADDLPYARRVAAHLDVDLHVVRVGEDMMQRLPEMVYLLDEPTPDPAALNALFISELARSHGIKVLLSGAGGDDIFTGYRRHYALTQERWWAGWPQPLRRALAAGSALLPQRGAFGRRIAKAFQHAGLDEASRLAGYFLWLPPARALGLLSPRMRAGLDEGAMLAPLLESLGELPPGTDPLNRMLHLECRHFLADHNLNYTDKMGMAAGVEVRVPLLDLELVDLAGRLPVRYKQHGRIGKWIFKRAMEPYLPREVIYRPKTGFGVPLRRWLQGPLRGMLEDALSPAALAARDLFDPAAVALLRADDAAGRIDASYSLFALICLELWCRQYVDGRHALDPDLETEAEAA